MRTATIKGHVTSTIKHPSFKGRGLLSAVPDSPDVAPQVVIDTLGAGIVLTGGATAMDGMCEVAEHVLGLPCRRGAPTKIGGLVDVVRSPAFSTGVGLVMFGAAQANIVLPVRSDDRPGMFKRAWSRLAEMF